MKKQLLALAALLAAGTTAQAQRVYPLVTISDIQTVSATDLAACNDAPARVGDTVRVRGIVMVPGGQAQSASGRQVWIRSLDGDGPFKNIGIRFGGGNVPTTPTDLQTVLPGDTLEVTGLVQEFNGTSTTNPTNDGETQINPLADGVRNIGDGTGPAPTAVLLPNVGILNDNQRLNNLTTGEQVEGAFVEIQNVTVTAINAFGTPVRYTFTVQDAQGNKVEVSDRFLAARTAGGFVPPAVGDQFNSIRGIVIHSKNRCQGTGTNNRGYEIHPFNASHYVRGASSPSIGGLTRLPIQPCSRVNTSITATITDDGSIASATLVYTISGGAPQQVAMTATGSNIYTAAIPGQADGTLVTYYIRAVDNAGNVSISPSADAPAFFTSRCGGPSVRDLQFTPFSNGNSGYNQLAVDSVRGVVVSTTADLNSIYIITPGATEWGGIWLVGGATIATLNRGDEVLVAGQVQERGGMTCINVTSATVLRSNVTFAPIDLATTALSPYDFALNEKYEGMLVRVNQPQPLFVVDSNHTGTSTNPTANFGEWRVGPDVLDPNSGVIVQTANFGGSNYGSKNVSFISGRRWISALNPGVTPIIVQDGDRLQSITGLVYFSFGNFKLLPRNTADVEGYLSAVRGFVAPGNSRYVLSPSPMQAGTFFTLTDKRASLEGRSLQVVAYDNVGKAITLQAEGQANGNSLRIKTDKLTAGGLYYIVLFDAQTGYKESHKVVAY